MSNVRQTPKYKICRRLGENLWGRDKCPTNTNPTGPGMHGARRKKLTDYGIQLREKQKLKGYYGDVKEGQFRTIFKEAVRRKGDTSENLIALLESRLDAIVYRLNFVPTVFAARQFVNHKHVMVNGKVVNIPSYRCRPGDVIEVREKSRQVPMVIEALEKVEREVPSYLTFEPSAAKGTFNRLPVMDEVPYPVQMNPNLVVEFYSR
ncbi:MAG: 30S ribosomal protein S4 [Magnetococcales bacterium]|nr:30S ribosomal protein S4 [Magnetococcales bacterium]PPR12432.1 MAG: 30S ribosomal protein S4 [Pseudomonadota bacterium]